jgi:hypothetical protein
MTADSNSMKTQEEDVQDVALPTQRRPDFVAEALSPRVRIGLLLLELCTAALLFFMVLALGIWPEQGVLALGEFAGVLMIGMWVALTFVVLLVYGALLANNAHLGKWERVFWYTLFAFAGPVVLPVYWWMHVWPAPYEPVVDERLSPERTPDPPPPYVRESNSTRVLPPRYA